MKIKEMDSHCGECDLIDYCGEPYTEPYLCCDNRFKEMEVDEYIRLAKTLKGNEIEIMEEIVKIKGLGKRCNHE